MSNKKNKNSVGDTQPLSNDELDEILELYSSEQNVVPSPNLTQGHDPNNLFSLLSSTSNPELLASRYHTEMELSSFQDIPGIPPPLREERSHTLDPVTTPNVLTKTSGDIPGVVTNVSFLIDSGSGEDRPLSSVPVFAYMKPPQLTMQMGSALSNVMVFFKESNYDRDAHSDRLHRALSDVTSADIFRSANWSAEKHTFLARLQVCIETTKEEGTNTIFMGDGDAFDTEMIRWDAGAIKLLDKCQRAGKVEVKIDPATFLVAFVARDFPEDEEMGECTEIGPKFPVDHLPIDYLRFDGVMQLGVGHKMISLAQEALRLKVLSVRDGTGVGGFRLPPCYRLDGLLLQGSPEHPVYLSQLFANQTELSPDNKVGRHIAHIHLGRYVDLGEEHFPIPPMSINVLSVQYPHDLDRLSQLLEGWEGTIDKLVLWGYRDSSSNLRLHEEYPLFMAMTASNALPVRRIAWIESKVGSQTFEWIQFSEIDCQVFGQNFEHLSVETVAPGQLMMVLRGFGQSLSPKQIEDYLRTFRTQLKDVPVMVKRLFLGTYNASPKELEAETARIHSEQQALWSRIEQNKRTETLNAFGTTQDHPSNDATPVEAKNPFVVPSKVKRSSPDPQKTTEHSSWKSDDWSDDTETN